jgi:hypothetical protein
LHVLPNSYIRPASVCSSQSDRIVAKNLFSLSSSLDATATVS